MYQEVLSFWFHELEPAMWWKKDDALDALIKERFSDLHQQAVQGELFCWRDEAQGALAEILVLDQFSRNLYRDQAQAYASDPMALTLAQCAIEKGFDRQLPLAERSFIYLPFMHSESALIHKEAVKLFTELGNPENLEFELKHKAIIDEFGRYPHRNQVLGRVSTEAELAFLKQPGSSF